MREQFMIYLKKQGYSIITPAGNPSTVYDYAKRIDKICEKERLSWEGLAANIVVIIAQYDTSGEKEDIGRQSHNAVINALRRFSEFLLCQ